MGEKDELKAPHIGQDLFDLEGDRIGSVEDVIYGDATGDPEWLVVSSEAAGAERILLPAGEVRRAGDHLSVPHSRDRVGGAPKVEDGSVLTEAEKGKLCRYYGLLYVGAAGDEPTEGCVDMPDQRPGG